MFRKFDKVTVRWLALSLFVQPTPAILVLNTFPLLVLFLAEGSENTVGESDRYTKETSSTTIFGRPLP